MTQQERKLVSFCGPLFEAHHFHFITCTYTEHLSCTPGKWHLDGISNKTLTGSFFLKSPTVFPLVTVIYILHSCKLYSSLKCSPIFILLKQQLLVHTAYHLNQLNQLLVEKVVRLIKDNPLNIVFWIWFLSIYNPVKQEARYLITQQTHTHII